MKTAHLFLQIATTVWPPPSGRSHALHLKDGILALSIVGPEGQLLPVVTLDGAGDLEKDPDVIIREIHTLFETLFFNESEKSSGGAT